MEAAHRAGLAQLSELNQFIADENWAAAETLLVRIHSGLDQHKVFFQSKSRHPFYAPFANQHAKVAPEIDRQRREAALEVWLAAAESAQPQYEQEEQRIAALLEEVRGGRAAWNGQTLEELELIGALRQQWLDVQLQMLRALGYWQSALATDADRPGVLSRIEELRSAHEAYSKALQAAIVGIIDLDSQRVASEEIPNRYATFLMALAPIADWTEAENIAGAPRWEELLAPVLARYLQRSPELQARLNIYRAATNRVLHWRERVATAREKAVRQDSPEIAMRIAEATAPGAQFQGLHAGRFGGVFQLQTPAREALLAVSSLQNQPGIVGPCHRLPWEEAALLSTFRHSTYVAARVPDSAAYDAAARRLQTDLLLDRGFAPLTLEAARAQYALQRREPLVLLGTIREIQLEPWAVRFAQLPPSGRAFVRF